MIQFSEQLINTGTATQINLKPILSYTTDDAISTFTPNERNCYANGEANLTHLPYNLGFRYEMNNCLIDQRIRDIIWNCRCLPHFADYLPDYLQFIPMCFGEKLYCANSRMRSMGMRKSNSENNITMLEAQENPDKIGNISKPDPIDCMPACKVQHNNNQMSFALFPQHKKFFYQKTFCYVASHIWQITCQNEHREYFMRKDQPLLCPTLKIFEEYFENTEYLPLNSTVMIVLNNYRIYSNSSSKFSWTSIRANLDIVLHLHIGLHEPI